MLLLEDDFVIHPDLFRQLPCLLAGIPEVNSKPWHVVRLNTWGGFAESDLVNSLPAEGLGSRLYNASDECKPASSSKYRVCYGGTHAVLVQRRSVNELIDTISTRILPLVRLACWK